MQLPCFVLALAFGATVYAIPGSMTRIAVETGTPTTTTVMPTVTEFEGLSRNYSRNHYYQSGANIEIASSTMYVIIPLSPEGLLLESQARTGKHKLHLNWHRSPWLNSTKSLSRAMRYGLKEKLELITKKPTQMKLYNLVIIRDGKMPFDLAHYNLLWANRTIWCCGLNNEHPIWEPCYGLDLLGCQIELWDVA
ncbi:uncharacterized protein BDW43DRAFT_273845 [Aspergillus alliaceus]|uniref:uncharacterized protein n=1 Tax=Petromyces alliaceus TaxID=209559 RepID=UPI0012A52AE2|nr:uncharacterized protein BDW43DRAFT_273845 [Aspergillus alliaceus]KAB8234331.1 hypothetical protein BDW43DRAFT_273845 [Aspergillus alliaceus]